MYTFSATTRWFGRRNCPGSFFLIESSRPSLVLHLTTHRPLPLKYFKYYSYIKASQCDTRTKLIAYYFCEKCMPEFHMLEFKPSVIASAAVLLALKSQDPNKQWSSTLEHYTKYTLEDITSCAEKIIAIVQKAEDRSSLQAIRKKYAQAKFGDAAGAAFRVKSL